MEIDKLMLADGASIYYDAGFRTVLEDHMAYLRTTSTTRVIDVPPGDGYRFEYDFYGFLSKWGVPAQLHWIALRMNRLTDPSEFGPDVPTVLVPDLTVIERLRQSHMTSRRVT